MKKAFKYLTSLLAAIFILFGCEIAENPKFLTSDNLFSDVTGANTVLNGVYSSLASFSYYGADYHHLLNMSSGLYNTDRDASLLDIAALNPPANLNFVNNVWQASFQAISRANDLIANLETLELENTTEKNNILGQAYLIRSLTYFNLVRIYGKCPLITQPVTSQNPYFEISTPGEIYEQIIADATKAETMLPDLKDAVFGRPAKYAANMLLAKVYMQLASNKTAQETDNWQKAYTEAMKVYGKYTLVKDFATLWNPKTSDNSTESIFEIQGNVENTLRMVQLWTPGNGHVGRACWGRFKPNLEVYDKHVTTYPKDNRVKYTFVTEWQSFSASGATTPMITYPTFKTRNNKDKSYPYGYKYFIKDVNLLTYDTDMNYVVFRYADLLLMLAEIENEINGPTGAYKYVNEVLTRARAAGGLVSDQPANWDALTQADFRKKIMNEYLFELLEEGHDWFNVRRRGYDYFKANVIDVHNNHKSYDFTKQRDVRYPDNSRIMVMPIPDSEITSNPKVSAADQNSGY